MKKILLLDTSIGTSNMGDFVIMECVRKELKSLLDGNFVYNMSTHLPSFSSFAVFRNSLAVQNYASADLKFAGGSNLLVKDLKTHYPQWNINAFNSAPISGTILVGVGAGAGEYTNNYTKKLYNKILSHEYYHSVRDERSKEYVEKQLGLKAINTGCVTMWMLTPEFCENIPSKKANRVVLTLTGKPNVNTVDEEDQAMIDILNALYDKVYIWIQGDLDLDYFLKAKNINNIEIIPPSIEQYDNLLNSNDLDYVGTRLHGGIYAMRHKKRTIIISIDERADAIDKGNNLNCIRKMDVPTKLKSMIESEFCTKIKMPFDEIKKWKAQFNM